MSATVIIPTYNRPQVVCRAVRGTLEQLRPGDCCMVVVQGTDAERAQTRRAISIWIGAGDGDETRDAALPPLIVIDQTEPGLTLARNRGLLEARTRYVVFLDDDAVPRKGWLAALLKPLEEDRADLVAGRLCESPNLTTNAPGRLGAVLTWTGHTRRNYDTERSGPTELAPGGNMAVRRRLAMRAGGFDPAFEGAAIYEDVEFSERMRNLSARIWYEAAAAVDHLAVRTGVWWARGNVSREVERARHMSIIFRRHRPRGWYLMAAAYWWVAVWKVLRGRLGGSALWRIPVALYRGRRRGAEQLPMLQPEEAAS